jgi:hypothetical protein
LEVKELKWLYNILQAIQLNPTTKAVLLVRLNILLVLNTEDITFRGLAEAQFTRTE